MKFVKNIHFNRLKNQSIPNRLLFMVLGDKCRRLESISIQNYTGVGFNNDLIGQILSTNCRTLVKLNFNSFNPDQVTVATIQPILLNNCKRLKVLRLPNCFWLTDGGIETFVLHLNKSKSALEELDIGNCGQISERSLQLLVKCSKVQLKVFNLRNCSFSVTDLLMNLMSISAIGQSIEHLNLINCKKSHRFWY